MFMFVYFVLRCSGHDTSQSQSQSVSMRMTKKEKESKSTIAGGRAVAYCSPAAIRLHRVAERETEERERREHRRGGGQQPTPG